LNNLNCYHLFLKTSNNKVSKFQISSNLKWLKWFNKHNTVLKKHPYDELNFKKLLFFKFINKTKFKYNSFYLNLRSAFFYSKKLINYKTQFITKILYSYYVFHKNVLFKYQNNLLFFYLNNKKVNKLNIIKKTIYLKFNVRNFLYINNKEKILSTFSFYSNKYITFNNLFFTLVSNTYIPFLNVLYNSVMFINTLPNNKDRTYSLNYYSKSFLIFNWILKKQLFFFLKTILFFIKYFLYLNIKNILINNNNYIFRYTSFSLIKIYNNLFINVLSNSFISSYSYKSYFVINFYTLYVNHNYKINYIGDRMLLSILKNNDFYYYYLKYYILNFLYLFYFIERTIRSYSNKNCYLLITYNLNWLYYINSAKMWCEYVVYNLKKRNTIRKLFFFIKKQQKKEKSFVNKVKRIHTNYDSRLLPFRYPLKGIRILYSGNFKKAKRKKKLHYYLWLSDFNYSGKMPLKKFQYYIDYHSSSVYLKRSSIGIKFWLLFNLY
jgi:hypothetical protein